MKFSDEQVTEGIKAAVEKNTPHYVYPEELMDDGGMCYYRVNRSEDNPNGEPACIVGYVLDNLGVAEIREDFESNPARYVIYALGIEISESAMRGLENAQGTQDGGGNWGKALKEYGREVDK